MLFSYKKICRLVEERGITFYKLAKATELSSTVFSDWKSGKSCPKVDKIKKLANYFNVPIEYFLEEEQKTG